MAEAGTGSVRQRVLSGAPGDHLFAGETVVPPGGRTDDLRHQVDEFVYVLHGELLAGVGADVRRLAAGEHVLVPRGEWHSFTNDTGRDAAMLFVFPGGVRPTTDSRSRAGDPQT